jgi:ribosomal protein S18 acetylase RimI-like enzyme
MQITNSAYIIRAATAADEPFLWEMLYQAIFVPEGSLPPPREIIKAPELARYVRDWSRMDFDAGFIAIDVVAGRPVGAAWLRLLTKENAGYGYVDDETPELSIAVLPEHRGRKVGTRLLSHLLDASDRNHKAVCLSVSAENPAVRLYERIGFEIVESSGESLTMKRSGAP